MYNFKAEIQVIGINPYVFLPEDVLKGIFGQAKKDKGPIPIRGTINEKPYVQTLVKFKGFYRLYINLTMLKNSPKRIGETIDIDIEYDPKERIVEPHPKLIDALDNNQKAKIIFENLRPSLKNEIIRYISRLKSEESIDKNVLKAIDFLLGNGSFVGRDKI